ncbi:hypothetical protein GCM10023340_20680 [Nocardioides marinquilinus]|uniref:NlpC/P60 domain-containing protein n=1 Tax=Nocardioides marinquilinus TaxID=1210400 RepID=A0ABP9PMB1_9ACTN
MRAVRVAPVLAEPRAGAEQVTQLLPGERVEVHQREGDWLRVTAPAQASAKDALGYPGWTPVADLAPDEESVVAIARTFLGTTYVWGGLTHDGVDCSGLVHASFRAVGVAVPRDASDQASACEPVTLGEERPGDLWFFAKDGRGTRVTHVGFVTDPATSTMLHAPDSGPRRYVVEEPLPDARRATLVSAGRF